ncbi:ALF repeat-containing protein, partial [Streptomyces sp. UNOC14_S4]|uniref:ALF repeat-containing protein n=1 Tax=Streptomyces sp. UNOC14_S4 TaxID=2872340 RepID=UPI001E592796
MKFTRVSGLVAAAVIAPAVLLSTPAVAATGAKAPAPAAAKAAAPSAEEDRAAIARILADKASGEILREQAQKALDGTPTDMRGFLETGQYDARDMDNSLTISRIGSGKDVGPTMKEAVNKALMGTREDQVRFLEKGQYDAREMDDML